MGHRLIAAIFRGPHNAAEASRLEMPVFVLPQEMVLLPFDPHHTDEWAERWSMQHEFYEGPLLNSSVSHRLIKLVAQVSRFAFIETDYFGGGGTQCAIVYDGAEIIMPPETAHQGPINRALQRLGVQCTAREDEFDAIGLGNYRDAERCYERYYG